MKHMGMSGSAMPPTQNGVARRLKPPKVTAFAALPIGTAIATSWRTVANDCEALRTAAGGCGRESGRRANKSQSP